MNLMMLLEMAASGFPERTAVQCGALRWNSLPRSEESGRSLRIEAGGNGGEARSISDSAGLSM